MVTAYVVAIVGSAAGVAGAIATIIFGLIPLRRRHRSAPAEIGKRGAATQVSGDQPTEVEEVSQKANPYIASYIEAQNPIITASSDEAVVIGEVPQRAPAFQDRAAAAWLGQAGPGVSKVRAVIGMRGVGKTQVAAAYARSCIDAGWRLVAWVNADSAASVLNGLAEIAHALGIGQPDARMESIGGAVRHFLETQGERCLVVFDNATNVDFLVRFVPTAGRSQVVITSNHLESSDLGQSVNVDVFTEHEALRFLAQRTGRSDDAGAQELAVELGFLPLALSQAAAVIASEHLDYPTYLATLRTVPVSRLLKRIKGSTYAYGVAEAIILALDAAASSDSTGLCPGLINTIALMSPGGVSRQLLYAAGQRGLLWPSDNQRPAQPQSINEALGRLASASLLTFSVDDTTVTAHRLTMRVARERQAQAGTLVRLTAGIADLLEAVTDSLDEPWRNWPGARDIVQQIMALHSQAAPYLRESDSTLAETMLRLGAWAIWFLNGSEGGMTQAIDSGKVLLADSVQTLGDTHPITLTLRNHLANAYQSAGRLPEAMSLLESTLADREQTLGATHPDTLTSRNDLAVAFQAAGRLSDAIDLLERTLTDREQTLGATHPDTLMSRNNLALAYQAVGRLAEAMPLYKQTLSDREQTLGATHPETLTSRNNLAFAYRRTGRLAEAIPLLEQTLADREQILGDGHHNTLGSRNNLARAYQVAGRLSEAITLHERNLADCQRILGATHHHTLTSRSNLALAYQAAGRLSEAIDLLESTLADRQETLGATHPDTLTSRNDLALAYQAAGRLSEAIDLLESTLADRQETLGATHPDTLTSRSNLAVAFQAAGRLSEAIDLLESTLADRQETLGATHPDTLTSRSNLALAYQAAGRLSEAIDLLESTLADRQETLGATHPDTLTSRSNLALAYQAAGRLSEAIDLLESTLADRQETLGATHPDTLTSRSNLALAYQAAGRLKEAKRVRKGLKPHHCGTPRQRRMLGRVLRLRSRGR